MSISWIGPPRPSPGVFSVGCDQSAVAVRIIAWLATDEFTLLFRFGTASRTLHGEYLLWAEVIFHREMLLRNPNSGMVNFEQRIGIVVETSLIDPNRNSSSSSNIKIQLSSSTSTAA